MDFKMQIITTDNYNGRGSDTILNSTYLKSNRAAFITHFQEKVNVGLEGSGLERGLLHSTTFVNNSSSWMRANAYLVVIYVSDEDDRTEEIGDVNNLPARDNAIADKYFKAISSSKSPAQLFKAFAIVLTAGGNSNQGDRYMKMAELSGGKSYSINGSFDDILSDFGKTSAAMASQYLLTYSAVASSVEVYINGVVAPQSDWSYLPSQNAVRFEKNATPSAGSTIRITYQIK